VRIWRLGFQLNGHEEAMITLWKINELFFRKVRRDSLKLILSPGKVRKDWFATEKKAISAGQKLSEIKLKKATI
jgi:hypothetical protein